MKIKLSKIVGRPIVMGGAVVGYGFVQALQKLAADPLPVKVRYALGRTIEDCERWVKSFEESHQALVKKYCVTRREFLERRATALREDMANGKWQMADGKGIPGLQASLKRIETELQRGNEGELGGLVSPDDATAEKLNAEYRALLEEEVEIFLDKKIVLPDDSKLTGGEMATLMDLIAVE